MSAYLSGGLPNLPALLARHQDEGPCRKCVLAFPPIPERYITLFGLDAAILLTHLLTTPPILVPDDDFVFHPDAALFAATHLRASARAAALRILERCGIIAVRDDGDGRHIRINEDPLEAAWNGATYEPETAA
jgi:hypothetical protein